jgi:hypothetical protein
VAVEVNDRDGGIIHQFLIDKNGKYCALYIYLVDVSERRLAVTIALWRCLHRRSSTWIGLQGFIGWQGSGDAQAQGIIDSAW